MVAMAKRFCDGGNLRYHLEDIFFPDENQKQILKQVEYGGTFCK